MSTCVACYFGLLDLSGVFPNNAIAHSNQFDGLFPYAQNISKANRERASNPKHPYKKSRMGYARLEQKIRKDTQADQPLGRHILWKEARVNKEGVVDNENVKKVVELCETIEQSSETQEGNKDTCRDILGKVFNVPEYSGRVRGKGFGVTPKSFFPQEKRQKPSNEEVLEKLRILSEQVALLVNTNKDKQLPVQLQPEIQMESETGSCNVGLKNIVSLNKEEAKDIRWFCKLAKRKLGDGCKVSIWLDIWIGKTSLKDLFLRKFA
ncbi:uncharacterized protein [Cicer arietinum]|uniref:uncharacterized protein n=1 Tax=Cicer arietinum TaxID=3827 RepID=UPI003CC5EE50